MRGPNSPRGRRLVVLMVLTLGLAGVVNVRRLLQAKAAVSRSAPAPAPRSPQPRKRPESAGREPPPPASVLSLEDLPAVLRGRNPFARLPGREGQQTAKNKPARPKGPAGGPPAVPLRLVLLQGRLRLAVVGTRLLREGERWGRERVAAIGPEGLVLEGPWGRRTVGLPPPDRRPAPAPAQAQAARTDKDKGAPR